MDQDTALQVVVAYTFHIGGETSGVRSGVERGEKHLQMIGHDLVEQRLARNHVVPTRVMQLADAVS